MALPDAREIGTERLAHEGAAVVDSQAQSIRALQGTADSSFSFGPRALRPAAGAEGDRFFATDVGWLYYFTGTSWAYLAGIGYGTNAARAAVSVSSVDTGAWWFATDTGAWWQVASGAWVERSVIPKSKLNATVAPAVGNDSTQGYGVGSQWIDVTADDAYVCLDASAGAAVWKKTTP